MKKEINLNQYFCISPIGCQGMLSIYEHKKLSFKQYYPYHPSNKGIYNLLKEVEKATGRRVYSWNLFPETYQDYQFEIVEYQIDNDAIIDGFEYDSKNGVVIYESIYGLYAVSDGENYYDVVTGEEIPWHAIGNVEEVRKPKEFQNMIQDLKTIINYMPIYVKMMEEMFSKFQTGARNKELAIKRYNENYTRCKNVERNKWIENQLKMQTMEQSFKIESTSHREMVRELIDQIRNGNETYYKKSNEMEYGELDLKTRK